MASSLLRNAAIYVLALPTVTIVALVAFKDAPLPILTSLVILLAYLTFYFCFLWRPRRTSDAPGGDSLPLLSTAALRKFHYRDLVKATKTFTTKIGSGAFSSVYHGTLADGTKIAVKCLLGDIGDDAYEELSTISTLNHENLLRLIGLCIDRSHRILVFEFMENRSLDKWIFSASSDRRRRIDWKSRRSIAVDIAKGLACLHASSILHLDIKPENILLDCNFRAKVSDFNLARFLRHGESRLVTARMRGTLGYMAPEWFYNRGITSKSDVYSYGVVLLEIVSGRRCVDRSRGGREWFLPSVAFQKARERRLDDLVDPQVGMPENSSEIVSLITIALACLTRNPTLRPSMTDVLFSMAETLEC